VLMGEVGRMSIQIERSAKKLSRTRTEREANPCSVSSKSYASCTATAKSRWKKMDTLIERGGALA